MSKSLNFVLEIKDNSSELKAILYAALSGVLIMILPGCKGILSGIYDEPEEEVSATVAGRLYLDASDWAKWHYIDFKELSDSVARNPDFNTSSLWHSYDIPYNLSAPEEGMPENHATGLYTYWYDVFGAGISVNEFRGFRPMPVQGEPREWSIAIHRNNVRTNGGGVSATPYESIEQIPSGRDWLEELTYTSDTWNQTDVWCVQDKMLLGIVGNQGIGINTVLGEWLTMEIPPMPPAFKHNSNVFVVKFADGKYAALQLADYMNAFGTKCHFTINYRYPL